MALSFADTLDRRLSMRSFISPNVVAAVLSELTVPPFAVLVSGVLRRIINITVRMIT